jgi:hypothetical protein
MHFYEKVNSIFFFEEPVVTGDTSDYDRKHCLDHVPVGTVFQLDGAPPHFSHCVCAFLDREFSDYWIGRGGPIS